MIDLDFKKKIANTLSRYELKCEKLQVQINTLKNVINELVIAPGINSEKNEHFTQLQEQLNIEFDAESIDKKVKRLVHVLDKLEKKKAEKQRNITHQIKESFDSLSRLALKSEDKNAVKKLQRLLNSEADNDELIAQINIALTLCTASVLREIDDLKLSATQLTNSMEISTKVNESLQQLLEHLSIPQNLDLKRENLKTRLKQQLNGTNLSNVIDSLTELVVDAFNVEQKRFKGFLQELTNQLQDFNVFLKSSSASREESAESSMQLEDAVKSDIEEIKNHMDKSKSIEELSLKVNHNLMAIGSRIKEYRLKEAQRDTEYQKELGQLQAKLHQSEQSAEEIKNLLNHQKYKINHDRLTGLPNRESYDEYIMEAFKLWKEQGKQFTLAVGDIDHFKQINDTFGHLAGDKVLKKIASIFNSSIRDNDYIARFGGEEFVLIFTEINSQGAFDIVEKLRRSIEECQFVYRDSDVDVTVSFGLTTILESDDIESLFMRADNALYKAKNVGRNRSIVF